MCAGDICIVFIYLLFYVCIYLRYVTYVDFGDMPSFPRLTATKVLHVRWALPSHQRALP